MTEISLIVTLNNQFNPIQFSGSVLYMFLKPEGGGAIPTVDEPCAGVPFMVRRLKMSIGIEVPHCMLNTPRCL